MSIRLTIILDLPDGEDVSWLAQPVRLNRRMSQALLELLRVLLGGR